MENSIDYQKKLDGALRLVVRDVLAEVAEGGLPGDHHFFVTFRTHEPNVRISDWLRQQYPEEMTVILQHQFWNLMSTDEGFGVTLRFSGVEERVEVPWEALTVFADPSVEFGLQLRARANDEEGEESVSPFPAPIASDDEDGEQARIEAPLGVVAPVVQIEDFRR